MKCKVILLPTETLENMIDALCEDSAFTISVTALSNKMCHPLLSLPFEKKIHSIPFCDTAKKQPTGYNRCIRCKSCCNRKAIHSRKPFSGYCSFGLYEVVYPVIFANEPICIIYIGNLCPNKTVAIQKLEQTAAIFHSDSTALRKCLQTACACPDKARYFHIASLLAAYIQTVLSADSEVEMSTDDWRIAEILEYLQNHWNRNISVKMLSAVFFYHEKYLGHLFAKKTGKTVREYLRTLRLENAKKMLEEQKTDILQIALRCGFSSDAYFDRCFKAAYGVTPRQWRFNAHKY